MKIISVETKICAAGWRPWVFVKMKTDTPGIEGWSEITDSNGSPQGMMGVIRDLEPILIGKDPRQFALRAEEMALATRQSPGGIVQKSIAGCVNAMLDITGKHHGVSVAALFGGPVRATFPAYWSHFGTTRVRAYECTGTKKVATLSDYKELLKDAQNRGYSAVKSNILMLAENSAETASVYMPGFGRTPGGPELNLNETVHRKISELISAAKSVNGPRLIMDLNLNFKPEGMKQILRSLAHDDLLWMELDCYYPEALVEIKSVSPVSICSGENLYGLRQYLPFLKLRAMDVASIDLLWNGFSESIAIAKLAEVHEINVSPHNFNSALGDAIAANFCAVVPNLRMCEFDLDDVPWKNTLVTSHHRVDEGKMQFTESPGWGVTINEALFAQHPWPRKA